MSLETDESTISPNLEGEFRARHWADLERVYRFHLARTGETPKAEDITRLTFQTGLEWFDHHQKEKTPHPAWLFLIACFQNPISKKNDLKPAGDEHFVQEDVREEGKRQNALEMQIALIADRLNSLPVEEANAIALHLFAGLDMDDTGRVLGKSQRKTESLISRGLKNWLLVENPQLEKPNTEDYQQLISELRGFASSLHPDNEFIAALDAQLARSNIQEFQVNRTQKPEWLRSRRLSRFTPRLLFGMIPVLLFGLLMVTLLKERPEFQPVIPDKQAKQLIPSPVAITDIEWAHGYLVPPGIQICKAWQNQLSERLEYMLAMNPAAPVQIPGSVATEERGMGCVLYVFGIDPSPIVLQEGFKNIETTLKDQGYESYSVGGQSNRANARSNPENISRVFHRQGEWVSISMDLPPLDSVAPSPGSQGQSSPVIQIELSVDAVRPTLTEFFELWKNGDERVIEKLGIELSSRFPDVKDLDDLADIQRFLLSELSFNWWVLENAGDYVRLQIEVEDRQHLQADPPGMMYLQLIVAPGEDGWRIVEIGEPPIFPPTRDVAVVANSEGQVFSLDITTGEQKAISAPGVYEVVEGRPIVNSQTLADNTLVAMSDVGMPLFGRWGRMISPQGNWLVLSNPSENATRVLSLSGEDTQKIDTNILEIAWAEDEQQFVYITPNEPDKLYIYNLAEKQTRLLSRIEGQVQWLVWSPSSEWIAMTSFLHFNNPIEQAGDRLGQNYPSTLFLSMINPETGKVQILIYYPSYAHFPSRDGLTWSEDSKRLRLWNYLEFDITTHEYSRLVAHPIQYTRQFEEQWISSDDGYTPYRTIILSPDLRYRANLYKAQEDSVVTVHRTEAPGMNHLNARIDYVEAMAWTEESHNLILAGGFTEAGTIWRMNPINGERVKIAEDLLFIGLLYGDHRNKPMREDELIHLALPDPLTQPLETWPTYHIEIPEIDISFRYPPGWKIWFGLPEWGSPNVILSSTDFRNRDGWARFDADTMYLPISFQRWGQGTNRKLILEQWRQDAREGRASMDTTTVAGRNAYWITYPGNLLLHNRNLEILLESGMISFRNIPSNPVYRTIFEQVLESIQISED